MSHHETIKFLTNQVWRPAAQNNLGATQVGLQFVQGSFDFPANAVARLREPHRRVHELDSSTDVERAPILFEPRDCPQKVFVARQAQA